MYCGAKCYDQLLVRFKLMARVSLKRCDELIIAPVWLWNLSLFPDGPSNQYQFSAKVAAGQSWVARANLRHIDGNSILTLGPLANVDVHLPSGKTNCQTVV